MEYLYLDDNQLSDTIPNQLNKLMHLSKIFLNNNQLSGRVIQFAKMNDLQELHLENNNFTFAGMAYIQRTFKNEATYGPQAAIPMHKNGNVLSVYTGGADQLEKDTFKWFKDGNLIATIEGDSIYQPTANGAYFVEVTNTSAKRLTLQSTTIQFTASENSIASKLNNNSFMSVYPNPAKAFATLSFSANGKYSITVADASGKILQTKTGVANKSANIIQLDVSKYASGVYLITIADEKNKKQTVRLNKE